jgi:hypothetical protein
MSRLGTFEPLGWRSVTLWVRPESAGPLVYGRYSFEPDGFEMTHEFSGEREIRLRGRIAT